MFTYKSAFVRLSRTVFDIDDADDAGVASPMGWSKKLGRFGSNSSIDAVLGATLRSLAIGAVRGLSSGIAVEGSCCSEAERTICCSCNRLSSVAGWWH